MPDVGMNVRPVEGQNGTVRSSPVVERPGECGRRHHICIPLQDERLAAAGHAPVVVVARKPRRVGRRGIRRELPRLGADPRDTVRIAVAADLVGRFGPDRLHDLGTSIRAEVVDQDDLLHEIENRPHGRIKELLFVPDPDHRRDALTAHSTRSKRSAAERGSV